MINIMIIYFIYQERKMKKSLGHPPKPKKYVKPTLGHPPKPDLKHRLPGADGLPVHNQHGDTSKDFQLLKHGYDSPTKFEVEIQAPSGGLFITRTEMIQALKTINIPQFNDESIETFFNNQWVFARGRSSIFQIQLTLKNINSMDLYQKCLNMMNDNIGKYPADQYFTIKVTYTGTYENDTHKTITFHKCMMSNLSDLSFDHSAANSTMDFSVGFKSNSMIMS
jgi:hypothetical protein